MNKIIVKVEITDIDNWDVDWNNDKDKSDQLTGLSQDIQEGISVYAGINYSNLHVFSEYQQEETN